jgi:hypothetical protein
MYSAIGDLRDLALYALGNAQEAGRFPEETDNVAERKRCSPVVQVRVMKVALVA